MDSNIYILDKVLNFNFGSKRVSCVDKDLRALISSLIKVKILTFDMNCDNFQAPGAKQLTPDSASRSIQWLNASFKKFQKDDVIIRNLINNFILLIQPIDFIKSKKTVVAFTNDDVNTLMKYFIDNLIKIVDLISPNFVSFIKLSGISNLGHADVNNNQIFQEVDMYDKLSSLLSKNITPHIPMYHHSLTCKAVGSIYNAIPITYSNNGMPTQSTLIDYFNASLNYIKPKSAPTAPLAIIGYNILIVEMVKNSVSLKVFLENLIINKIDGATLLNILFQLLYTLNIFTQINFIHCDLHVGNVYIETCDEYVENYYIISDNMGDFAQCIKLKSKYVVKIIDFDRSFFIKSNAPYNNDIKASHLGNDYGLLGALANKYKQKYDIFYVFKYIERQTNEIVAVPDYAYPKYMIDHILYNIPKDNIGYNTAKDLRCQSSLNPWDATVEINEATLKITKTPDEAMDLLLSLGQKVLPKSNITIYDDLTAISWSENDQIFTYPNINVDNLREQMELNVGWFKLSTNQKSRICSTIVKYQDYVENIKGVTNDVLIANKQKIEKEAAERRSAERRADTKMRFRGNNNGQQVVEENYYEKYLKYKKKYLSTH